MVEGTGETQPNSISPGGSGPKEDWAALDITEEEINRELNSVAVSERDRSTQGSTGSGEPSSLVGGTGREPRSGITFEMLVVGSLLGVLFFCWVAGLVQRGTLDLSALGISGPPAATGSAAGLTLVEAQGDRVLILEGGTVLVQTLGRGDPQMVGQGDPTVANAALSPDGRQVVYYSEQLAAGLTALSLDSGTTVRLESTALTAFAAQRGITGTALCPWTPVVWAPDARRVAFFGCRELPPYSLVFVARVNAVEGPFSPADVITGTEAMAPGTRQLRWAGDRFVVFTFPQADGNAVSFNTAPVGGP